MEKSIKEIEKLCARISSLVEKNAKLLRAVPHPSDYFTRRGLRFSDYVKEKNKPELDKERPDRDLYELRLLKRRVEETIANYRAKNSPR